MEIIISDSDPVPFLFLFGFWTQDLDLDLGLTKVFLFAFRRVLGDLPLMFKIKIDRIRRATKCISFEQNIGFGTLRVDKCGRRAARCGTELFRGQVSLNHKNWGNFVNPALPTSDIT